MGLAQDPKELRKKRTKIRDHGELIFFNNTDVRHYCRFSTAVICIHFIHFYLFLMLASLIVKMCANDCNIL